MYRTLVTVLAICGSIGAQTPVIGGTCKLGTADVQIGGKQTQFFLKCETTADSSQGEGVWVVKSRSAASSQPPPENTQPQQHPKARKPASPNICEQDNSARDGDSCAVSATCLQAHPDVPSSYLQCDQGSMRWIRKSCQEGYIFNFEQQTCIVPKRMSSLSRQQSNNGLVCTFASCSNSNPCSVGTCNNGYCCSSSSGSSSGTQAFILSPSSNNNNNCVGCGSQNSPQIITIPQNSCPGGGYSVGSCSTGYCATGYTCVQNQCCPSYNSPPKISVYTCSTGASPVGACMSGRCASGYQCQNNVCCPQQTTSNPFVCPDGTQAAGGCVNGQCGAGYTCSNGLCCAGTTNAVRCLDGSEAVGACIPSCTGDGCGGVQVTYYCGSGYTCTTGNICCAVNSCPNGGEVLGPAINGLCPTGYALQGNVCCSQAAKCDDGSEPTKAINNVCIPGYKLVEDGMCCPGAETSCTADLASGTCTGTGFNGGCQPGYVCDTANGHCCPYVTYEDENCQLGPVFNGACPPSSTAVEIQPEPVCVDLQCTIGVCPETEQIGECQDGECPPGYSCYAPANICCKATTFRKRLNQRGQRLPAYGQPLNSFMPPRALASTCAGGQPSAGPCINGLCGIGYECQLGKCCPESAEPQFQSKCANGETAVSGCFTDGTCGTGYQCVQNLCCPPSSRRPSHLVGKTMPIGARCMFDGECVGNSDGLSMCDAGVCQCSPIAYTQGIACVRRKSFQMNDEPLVDGKLETADKQLASNKVTAEATI